MNTMKAWWRLLRPFHWVKNLLVIFPLFFSARFADFELLFNAVIGFLAFCGLASSIYVLNDIEDYEKDKQHPTKRYRPIASGEISIKKAKIGLCCILALTLGLAILDAYLCNNVFSLLYVATYFVLNIMYSKGLKRIPIIDVACVAAGFILRVYYGGSIVNVAISDWLFLTVAAASFFLGFGKRRNEILQSGSKSRDVLNKYSLNFLTPILYVFLGLTITFYSLWAIQLSNASNYIIITIILVMIIVAEYSRIIESGSDGDPAEVLKRSKILVALVCVFAIVLACAIYIE